MNRLPKFTIRTLFVVTLLSAVGVTTYLILNPAYKVAEIPRPNSGEFSTAEATRLLPASLEKCVGIDGEHDIVQISDNGYRLRVHVFRDGRIRVTDWVNNKSYGILALENAMVNFPRWGGAANALMTSDTDGWDTTEKKQVIERLFQPAWQIHVVNGR